MSLMKGLGERISNPVVSTFAIAFSIYNWPITLAIFTGDAATPTSRGDAIKSIWESSVYEGQLSRLLLFPLISTVIYLCVMPYLRKAASAHLYRRQVEGDKIKARDYFGIIGEMHKHEEIINEAHDEFQKVNNAYQSVMLQINDIISTQPLAEEMKSRLRYIIDQNTESSRRIREADKKFLNYYLLIQERNRKK